MIVLGRDELVDVPLAWPVESSTVLARARSPAMCKIRYGLPMVS